MVEIVLFLHALLIGSFPNCRGVLIATDTAQGLILSKLGLEYLPSTVLRFQSQGSSIKVGF
ncbi:hypothetical protein BV372_28825 [Nostoc sp. T09]|nr:hypothetical protein BV372_28825 [Nostoc sp. T09]